MLCVCATLDGAAAANPDADRTDSEARKPVAGRAFVPPAANPAKPPANIARQKDGTLLIAGRALRCGSNRNVLDRHLPNLGLAAPGVLVFNPRQLSRWPDTVRLFVYHHECGHHHVGGDELAADCWAVKAGVREGWLDRRGLQHVCRSFGGGPATSTHPSGARRCASLDRCFATAAASQAKEKAAAAARAPAPAVTPAAATDAAIAAPKLIEGPVLQRSGMNPIPEAK
jgi:hypothetical protein